MVLTHPSNLRGRSQCLLHPLANQNLISVSNEEIATSRPCISVLHKCLGRIYRLHTLFLFSFFVLYLRIRESTFAWTVHQALLMNL